MLWRNPGEHQQKLTPAQEQRLHDIWEQDPEKCFWSCYPGGVIKDKTLLALRDRGLIECSYLYGNSMRIQVTVKGIHWLHGEQE